MKRKRTGFFQMPKLRYFSLETSISEDFQLFYLKWLVNNFDSIEKLQLRLRNRLLTEAKSFPDANFICQYCLPDKTFNLIALDFYICSEHPLSSSDTEKLVHSFQFDPFFAERQWTNIKCSFDPIKLRQYVSSCFSPARHWSSISK